MLETNILILSQLLQGIKYIHETLGIAHGHITTNNILLDRLAKVKIGEFFNSK